MRLGDLHICPMDNPCDRYGTAEDEMTQEANYLEWMSKAPDPREGNQQMTISEDFHKPEPNHFGTSSLIMFAIIAAVGLCVLAATVF